MGEAWKLSSVTGLRTTTAALVPLMIGQWVGETAVAMMVGIGGLNVSLSDIGGPYRNKAVTMGVATVSVAAAAFLGTMVGGSLWLSIPLMFVFAGAAGLVGIYGNVAAVAELATATVQGQDRVDLEALDEAAAAVDSRMTTLQQGLQVSAEDSAERLDLQNLVRVLQGVTRHVHAAINILARHGDGQLPERLPVIGEQARRARLDVVTSPVQDNLTWRSLSFRHALRLGITAAAAMALYMWLDLPHGAWVPLTAMVISKPNFGGTYQQAVQRVVGTVAGSVIGAILAAVVTDLLVLALLLVAFGMLAFSLMARNYGLGVLFLTPFILLLLNTIHPGNWQLAAVRSLDTGIGGLLALLAGYLLWPNWERERLPAQLARTIAANRNYFLGVMAAYLGQASNPASLQSTRALAQLENANAAAAFQRLVSEPKARRGPIGPMYALVTYNQRFYDGRTTLAVNSSIVSG